MMNTVEYPVFCMLCSKMLRAVNDFVKCHFCHIVYHCFASVYYNETVFAYFLIAYCWNIHIY